MLPGRRFAVAVQVPGGGLQTVQEPRYLAVVGLELVNDCAKRRRSFPNRREQHDVLVAVMGVDEATVSQTIPPQLKEPASRLHFADPRADLVRRRALGDIGAKLQARRQVVAKKVVHPPQLVEQDVGALFDVGHELVVSRQSLSSLGRR